MLPGLFYKACQLELAGILMLENVNKLQHLKLVYICCYQNASMQTQVYLPYVSNQLA